MNKRGIFTNRRGVLAASAVTAFMLPSAARASTQFTTWPFAATGGTATRTQPDRIRDVINVKEFGAIGNGVADDTAAIQAAIDYGFNNNIQDVFVPAGVYKTTAPIYIDPPGNLRSHLASPVNFAFSMNFHGAGAIGNNNQQGAAFYPNFNNAVAFYIGPGQGMRVANISIIGPVGQYRGLMNANGVGIGTTGGSGGSSRVLIEGVGVQNFYIGIGTAVNGNGTLGDSNTLFKCWVDNAYIAMAFLGNQNFINSCIDCTFGNATISLSALPGVGCTITGGNYSAQGISNSFSLSAISAVTATLVSNDYDYTFTATVASPDAYVGTVYNAYTIATSHFGVIPLLMTAFNSGTNVGSFKILSAWSFFHFPQSNAVSTSDLQAEIQAVTTLYAAEQVTTFQGAGLDIRGVHVENNAPTLFINATENVGQPRPVVISSVFFDEDPSFPSFAPANSPTAANLARYYAAMTFPFIWVNKVDVRISDSSLGVLGDPVMIDVSPQSALVLSLKIERVTNFRANVRTGENGGYTDSPILVNSPSLGSGEYDISPFLSERVYQTSLTDGDLWRKWAGRTPTWGFRPAPYVKPPLLVSDVTTLKGALPAITHTGTPPTSYTIGYPVIWGGQQYALWDWYVGSQASGYTIVSNHHFYSYGQNLTTSNIPNLSWSYKGQSFVVAINDISLIFPGLGVQLNDGSSNVLYMVTGIYPGLGYFTVAGAQNGFDTSRLSGTKTTVVTGTTIAQEAFSITQF